MSREVYHTRILQKKVKFCSPLNLPILHTVTESCRYLSQSRFATTFLINLQEVVSPDIRCPQLIPELNVDLWYSGLEILGRVGYKVYGGRGILFCDNI